MPSADRQTDAWRPRRSVLIIDRAASIVITLGGLAVLAAVLGICVYLFVVVLPLFRGGEVAEPHATALAGDPGRPVLLQLDEPGLGAMTLTTDATARLFDLDTGEVVAESALADGAVVSASNEPGEDTVAIALADGRVLAGELSLGLRLVGPDAIDAPEGETRFVAPPGTRGVESGGIVEATGEQGYRVVELDASADTLLTAPFTPVAIDMSAGSSGERFVVAAEDGRCVLATRTTRENFLTGERAVDVRTREVRASIQNVRHAFLLDRGQTLLLIDATGLCLRIDASTGDELERVDLSMGSEFGGASKLAGARSVAAGVAGGAHVWFTAETAQAEPSDGRALVLARTLKASTDAVVTAIAPGAVERVVLLGARDGTLAVEHGTSAKVLGTLQTGSQPAAIAISPRGDVIASLDAGGRLTRAEFEPGYPEVTFSTLFLPIRYEGEAKPSFVYQSSAAGDDAEVKISLTPLIFGTIKATFFAMVFATPIAVFAAIYSSEFLSHKVRRVVKPTVELMASLPSVVLGFVAAMVVAPLVRDHLSSVMAAFAIVPVFVMVAAHLWQMLPWRIVAGSGSMLQLVVIAIASVLGVLASGWAGPAIEPMVFAPLPSEAQQLGQAATDASTGLIPWLDGRTGSPWAGWVMVLFLPSAAIAWLGFDLLFGKWLRSRFDPAPVTVATGVGLAKLVFLVGVSLAIAMLLARAVTAMGLDARPDLIGPFTPRNTLVVGIIMGFAVIPIIYTISDDALTSVPASLRAASLGAGATPWQTALRVVLPVAASGIFSAIMIGLGRAVGETMIVLMATGNTPTMDWNIFSGFRTLAANIAVELPEAPVGGGHYRVLFLCGLVLFVMTLIINTTAELVRQHFRKRNAML